MPLIGSMRVISWSIIGRVGVSCCMIDAKTPPEERRSLVEDYRNGRITLMVNVDIFSEGWDVPEVEVIQLARPTLSLAKYLQQVGRGMRVSRKKKPCDDIGPSGIVSGIRYAYTKMGLAADV